MKTLITHEDGWRDRFPPSTFKKVKLKFIRSGHEPRVGVTLTGDRSDEDSLDLYLVLAYGEESRECREFEVVDMLPFAAVLRSCIFDLEGFNGVDPTVHGAFDTAVNYALNVLGSLEFYLEDGCVTAKYTFGSHYVYFNLDGEATEFFFETE